MARSRKIAPLPTEDQAAEAHYEALAEQNSEPATDFDPAAFDAQKVVHSVAEGTRLPDQAPAEGGYAAQHAPAGCAATIERRQFVKAPDPFGVEQLAAGSNRVRLLKSEGEGAWVIRFAHNPNLDPGPNGETYSKENPHPVLKMLKEAGYRWGFDGGDGKGGWGKAFNGDAYGADHLAARSTLRAAADMIGHKMDQGRVPD